MMPVNFVILDQKPKTTYFSGVVIQQVFSQRLCL
uniref:Uncharacterized protein n=1 Tax=Kalanchoe fedtschenkoi TaxID=63787 RepID=A0A7N0ZV77_KALFE